MKERVKVIAMYLPQFHRVKENDEWWGEGYTEWTAVQNATPLFEGHYQPRIPKNMDYYDLMDKNVMIRQSHLMEKYDISGLCFYHYWFKEGKKILEKPAENLLQWKEINMPFCFCWANESWGRSWSKFNGSNTWAPKFEKVQNNSEKQQGILLEQKYGGEEEWKSHFYYLLPFFKDSRYIYIDEKPIFLFYKPDSIDCLAEMIGCWEKLAVCEGLRGIYFLGANTAPRKYLDAVYWHEPQRSWKLISPQYKENVCCRHYDDIWNVILSGKHEDQEKIFYGGFAGYDDTPRKGYDGCIVIGESSDKFKYYMKKLLKKSELQKNKYVFLNAWNEWGEGMYLEPDEKNGNRYLKAVKEALAEYQEETFDNSVRDDDNRWIELNERYKMYWLILERWLVLKEDNINIADYFNQRYIKKVAVYGVGMLGKHLIKELKDSEIEIVYGIDRRAKGIKAEFPVLSPDDELPEADAIIMTIVYKNEDIVRFLKEKIKIPVISLWEIIFEC